MRTAETASWFKEQTMDGFAQRLADFASALTDADDFDATADQLIHFAVEAVGATYGGITVIQPHGRLKTLGGTAALVNELDHAQYELREGPCVEAATELKSLVSGSLADDPRWPRWGPEAARRGVFSVLSAEIHSRGQRIGALNMYSTESDAFHDPDVELARVLATQSAPVMAVMQTEKGLRQALETRTLIGQAQGILMERFEIDADRAFAALRRFSQNTNTPLRDVAHQLVTTRGMPADG